MIRSQSEWTFQMLLEEISIPAGSSVSSCSATNNVIGRSSTLVQSEFTVTKPEEASSDVVEIQKPKNVCRAPPSSSVDEMDPNHYQAILKSKLEVACAAVVLRLSTVIPEDSSASSGNQKQYSPVGSQTEGFNANDGKMKIKAILPVTLMSERFRKNPESGSHSSSLIYPQRYSRQIGRKIFALNKIRGYIAPALKSEPKASTGIR